MQIVLYKNSSESNKIGKSLSLAFTLTGNLREGSSTLSPVVRIASNTNLTQFNYLYIPSFNRYYFIKDIVSENNGVWLVSARVDVLESHKTAILANSAIIERQENAYNLYFSDPEWKVYENDRVMTRDFPSGFSETGTYYLTVAGGYQTTEV